MTTQPVAEVAHENTVVVRLAHCSAKTNQSLRPVVPEKFLMRDAPVLLVVGLLLTD
jgi:hypothetical protein